MLLDACFSFFSAHATAVHPCHAPGAQMSRALWMALAENYARFRAESLRKQQEWAEQSLQQTADDKKRRYILALRHELRYRQKNLGKPLTFQCESINESSSAFFCWREVLFENVHLRFNSVFVLFSLSKRA
eukprot:m.399725 g.399725  ORF g.399725 m.399725 type:complete len:131 (+) comp56437_c0_seq3:62-454(+)